MPELPEVETVRRSVSVALLGCRVEDVETGSLKLRLPLDAEQWRQVIGQRLESLDRRGKYLLARFGDVGAVVHLGMTGRLQVAYSDGFRPPHTHLVLRFEGDRELRFVDPRRFGFAVAMPATELDGYAPLPQLGPEPLEGDVLAALVAAARRLRAPVRNVLLDQRVLAGVGNIYACEALHRAGIRPARPVSRISPARLARLADSIGAVLREAVAAGGTTLADGGFTASDGQAGYFAVQLAVYGREGLACGKCGTAIRRRVLGGRSAFFCPSCQR
ncbi:MAG: bifunctional DNA-formamidopyrimidine glycosylase/DNA-(apurinic or apyrimidinic site) lyase [Thermoanaerobaculaceae bacterium]|nr:bifunctional DNA-formamidopyrimidine glycosylase/DNA-(apurinic or apyrimidinic site) lyase [Thermoanaerobaculaceae bacterium]MDI9620907.1 bifunctional DNA-formamidopyrimidine glycosylase/DNA-(apurinic or apyrimidinic site) lyase [Acidobacteriota bacterium]NLH10177.1 bifunctional DNA-formamidopyrimidine glycosylase/DNA-(apurinic or apyrimidinic site) lyase [Holophagae bacterium]HPW54775.1 bifunctional DNA-formamidopyrimidine glycosylase/DNA-(apurinic or apyrimidinic site) lyase [Thermoanaeroba